MEASVRVPDQFKPRRCFHFSRRQFCGRHRAGAERLDHRQGVPPMEPDRVRGDAIVEHAAQGRSRGGGDCSWWKTRTFGRDEQSPGRIGGGWPRIHQHLLCEQRRNREAAQGCAAETSVFPRLYVLFPPVLVGPGPPFHVRGRALPVRQHRFYCGVRHGGLVCARGQRQRGVQRAEESLPGSPPSKHDFARKFFRVFQARADNLLWGGKRYKRRPGRSW